MAPRKGLDVQETRQRTLPAKSPKPANLLVMLKPMSAAGGGTFKASTSGARRSLRMPRPPCMVLFPRPRLMPRDGASTACAYTRAGVTRPS
eukprot:scaffold92929_cov36-Tisochrysis_lutea.AAC.6